MATLISCVVPVRNGERYLAEALDSILAQDHRPLEVIVVDDGSTDGSATLAEAYGEPVRVIRQGQLGQAAARNRGVQESQGAFVAFLDADDRYRPGKLSRQLAELEGNPEAALCLCTAENFWEAGLEEEQQRYAALGRLRATHTFIAMLARRAVFTQLGLLDPGQATGEQVEWFLRASDHGVSICVIEDVLVERRMHAASHTHNLGSLDAYLDMLKRRIDAQRPPVEPLAEDAREPE